LKETTVNKPQFVYVIYINAARERIWEGLTRPEMTAKYWMHENLSDWKQGSSWKHVKADSSKKVDLVGTVAESDYPTRLTLTWAKPEEEGNRDKTSRVTFELEAQDWPGGPWTRVRVLHTDLADKEMLDSISFGWPAVMSGLKTYLEVGW
jgi:uncharacterized protein YndB with AHSA1/START domain